MRSSKAIGLVLILLAASGVNIHAAQQARERDRPARPERPNRDEVEGMMEAYILSKLQDSLDLTDEQFGRMVVAQKKLQDTRREYRRSRSGVLRRLRQTLHREEAPDEEIERLLSELETLRDGFYEDEKARYADIDAILDVRQRARYRILEVEIQRRLQQLMRRVRGERRQGRERPNRFP